MSLLQMPRRIRRVLMFVSLALLVLWAPVRQLYAPMEPYKSSPVADMSPISYMRGTVPPTPGELRVISQEPLKYNISFSGESLEELQSLVSDLIDVMTQPTYSCRKFVSQGGTSCQKIFDGQKMVCLDMFESRPSNFCMVYSFGVGHDLSFDADMGKLGCQVFSFDDDASHDIYKREPFPRVHFIHVRIGASRDVQLLNSHDKFNLPHMYLYRPLDNIMYLLDQFRANIDFLKIDIEGTEFDVLEESLFKTDVLERTRQVALEVHLSAFLDQNQPIHHLHHALTNYTRVFRGLEERGMRLAHYEPNFIKPELATLAGRTFSLFSELVWVNVKLKVTPKYRMPSNKLIDEVELN
ncbi:Methyltransferase-like protein 24-like 7 [Homarus americanus]|uniref:Methyltransferase-like protein 24-like 7 n=2 Tax=Homarus americanus TaxID=6706 RepID=A0A8J5MLP3_HOMAM|nr:Methyltransferase-like protein 24-like 7 [Homarus americanus]